MRGRYWEGEEERKRGSTCGRVVWTEGRKRLVGNGG